jgi:esterase/lipase
LESNFRKIRVRERDLEHRIEIIKAESQSIAASKDRMILELKRQIDQISSELNHAKAQVQETFGQFKERQETARRAVRALRIALTVLEGEEDSGSRKAE